MVPSCLPVQELWDHVVDQLQWRKKDLKSCSLVCRALVPRAQSYIFCDIYLSFHSGSNVTRLAHLLASSPHLIAYIRHLSLRECEAGTMNSLDGIPWSRLETLTIMRHDMNFTSDRKFADNPPAFEQLYTLVGLPSLRRLNIYGPFWRVPYLFPILDHCTSALERLEFENCNLRASFEPVVTRLAKKPKIRHLRLDQSSVGEVLMDPAFPLDVSSLTYVQLRCQIMPRSELAVILRSRSSIHTLDFLQIKHLGEEDLATIDISLFPALRCIKFNQFCAKFPGREEHPYTKMLACLPAHNTVTRVCFSVVASPYFGSSEYRPPMNVEGVRRDLVGLETVLLDPRMSALSSVEVDVVDKDVAELVRTAMPALHARGILTIYCSTRVVEVASCPPEDRDVGGSSGNRVHR